MELFQEKHYFYMKLAELWASRSKCLSRQVGAVLITPDGTQVGGGYNGPPRGVPHCDSQERLEWFLDYLINELGWKENSSSVNAVIERWGTTCPRMLAGYVSGTGLDLCPAAHAETNALINAAREGIQTKGLIMYVTAPSPCRECFKLIIQAGISRVYCWDEPDYDGQMRWLWKHSNVRLIKLYHH